MIIIMNDDDDLLRERHASMWYTHSHRISEANQRKEYMKQKRETKHDEYVKK